TASITLIVPKAQHGRAAGLVSTAQGVSTIVAPALAGVLVAVIGLEGIMLIDFVTFLFAVSTLLVVRFPMPAARQAAEKAMSMWQDIRVGWKYLLDRKGMLALLMYFTFINFVFGLVHVLL